MAKPKKPKQPREGETEIIRMPRNPTPEEFFGRLFATSAPPKPKLTRPNEITIPITDTMWEAAKALKQQLTEEQYNRLFESIVSLAGDELTVDADPVEEGGE